MDTWTRSLPVRACRTVAGGPFLCALPGSLTWPARTRSLSRQYADGYRGTSGTILQYMYM